MGEILKVGLIGLGKFGINYYRILEQLHCEGVIEFIGVATTGKSELHPEVAQNSRIKKLTDYNILLDKVDIVCVVTPPETHAEIVKQCLPQAHVLSEKPLTLKSSEVVSLGSLANKEGKVLMVGYLFRFNSLLSALRKKVEALGAPEKCELSFVNEVHTDNGPDPVFEFIHWLDAIDYLFGLEGYQINEVCSLREGRLVESDLCAEDKPSAFLKLGWGSTKRREILLHYTDGNIISADFLTQTLTMEDTVREYPDENPLRKEIETFLDVVAGELKNPVSAAATVRSVMFAEEITNYLK